jgi:GNAT superfamily N-acetyltransferase
MQGEVTHRLLGKEYKKNTYYLHFIATHPKRQGRGIASALIRHVTTQVFCALDFADRRPMNKVTDVFWRRQSIILMYLFTSISASN